MNNKKNKRYPPGYIPSTSKLNDTSKVIQVRHRQVNTKEIIQSSKVRMLRVLNVNPQQAKAELEKRKREEEEKEVLDQLAEFEKRDRDKARILKQEQIMAEERSKDSRMKSMNIHPIH